MKEGILNMQKVERFEGNYFQWLKEELSGWDRLPWAVFGGGVGFQLAILLPCWYFAE